MKIFMPNISTLEQWLCCTAAGVSPVGSKNFIIEDEKEKENLES